MCSVGLKYDRVCVTIVLSDCVERNEASSAMLATGSHIITTTTTTHPSNKVIALSLCVRLTDAIPAILRAQRLHGCVPQQRVEKQNQGEARTRRWLQS